MLATARSSAPLCPTAATRLLGRLSSTCRLLTLALVAVGALAPACASEDETASKNSNRQLSCDLRSENWYSSCSKGCGDVMVCQSFCADCVPKCMVPCSVDSDCALVGAGRCEISAKASNRCSSAPSKCP